MTAFKKTSPTVFTAKDINGASAVIRIHRGTWTIARLGEVYDGFASYDEAITYFYDKILVEEYDNPVPIDINEYTGRCDRRASDDKGGKFSPVWL